MLVWNKNSYQYWLNFVFICANRKCILKLFSLFTRRAIRVNLVSRISEHMNGMKNEQSCPTIPISFPSSSSWYFWQMFDKKVPPDIDISLYMYICTSVCLYWWFMATKSTKQLPVFQRQISLQGFGKWNIKQVEDAFHLIHCANLLVSAFGFIESS